METKNKNVWGVHENVTYVGGEYAGVCEKICGGGGSKKNSIGVSRRRGVEM